MTEIQPLQLMDISAPTDSMCGPEGCGCGAAEAPVTPADSTTQD